METDSGLSAAVSSDWHFDSTWSYVRRTFAFYREHWLMLLPIPAVAAGLDILHLFIPQTMPWVLLLAVMAAAIMGFLSPLAVMVVIRDQGKPAGRPLLGEPRQTADGILGSFKRGIGFVKPVLWISGLINIVTLGGMVLLLIPGIIMWIRVSLANYALFIDERRGFSALALSWHYVRGHGKSVFWRYLLFGMLLAVFGLMLASIIEGPPAIQALLAGRHVAATPPVFSQIVGTLYSNLVVVPMILIYGYLLYGSLKEHKPLLQAADEQQIKKRLTAFAMIGIGVIVAIIGFLIFAKFRWAPDIPLREMIHASGGASPILSASVKFIARLLSL